MDLKKIQDSALSALEEIAKDKTNPLEFRISAAMAILGYVKEDSK